MRLELIWSGVGGGLDQHQQFPEHGVEPWLRAGEGGSRGGECEVRLRTRTCAGKRVGCVCLSSAAEKRRHWAAARGEEARLSGRGDGSQPRGAETFLCPREMFFFSRPSLLAVVFCPVA